MGIYVDWGREINIYSVLQHIKKQRHHFASKSLSSQSYGFSSTCKNVRTGPLRRLCTKELKVLNYDA